MLSTTCSDSTASRGTVQQFITERRYLKNVSAKTVVWYDQAFKSFTGALDSRDSIVKRIAELRQRGVKAISVNSWLRVVNAYFRWAEVDIKIPKLKEEQKILATLATPDIARLISYKPVSSTNLRRAHLIALTILDTGLRASEVLGLTKEACDFDNLVLRVIGKGGKHRLIPFSSELRKVLWRYTVHNTTGKSVSPLLLFGTKNNTKVSVRNLNRDFKILGKKLGITGIRFSPHTLRHTFAVSYLRNGGNLEFLRRILGHTTLATTQKYLRSLGVEDLAAVHSHLSPLRSSGR